jgi:hypothetical protein
MRQVVADDRVNLRVDVPELGLAAGQIGRVVSTWFYPNTAFEVEFAAERGACTPPCPVIAASDRTGDGRTRVRAPELD